MAKAKLALEGQLMDKRARRMHHSWPSIDIDAVVIATSLAIIGVGILIVAL
jgi:hypothetical protein